MLPILPLSALSNTWKTVLNANEHFLMAALAPILYAGLLPSLPFSRSPAMRYFHAGVRDGGGGRSGVSDVGAGRAACGLSGLSPVGWSVVRPAGLRSASIFHLCRRTF